MRKSMAQPARKKGAAPQGIELVLAAAEGRSWPGVSGRQKKGADPLRCSTTTDRSILGRCPLGDRLSHNRHAIRMVRCGIGAESSCFLWGASDPKRGCVLRVFFFAAAQGPGDHCHCPRSPHGVGRSSILDQRRGSIYPRSDKTSAARLGLGGLRRSPRAGEVAPPTRDKERGSSQRLGPVDRGCGRLGP